MGRIIIAGVETVAGQAIARRASQSRTVEAFSCTAARTTGLGASRRFSSESLTDPTDIDAVVFCGGGSQSSWDNEFGLFDAEQSSLAECVNVANEASASLIYISSDAVFDGPWIFHDDDCRSYAETRVSEQLRDWEELAASAVQHLVIRTNVLGSGNGSWLTNLANHLQSGRPIRLNARQWSTPLAEASFSDAVVRAIDGSLTGYVNIGGAERTTAFRFASQIATAFGLSTELVPVTTSAVQECGLRSHRIRNSVGAIAPVVSETLDLLVESCDSSTKIASAA